MRDKQHAKVWAKAYREAHPEYFKAYERSRSKRSRNRKAYQKTYRKTHKTTKKYTYPKGYTSWSGMKSRCDNPKYPKFKDYGGRGITYCDRWKSFAAFYADMGERPAGLTLERKDVNGNYTPRNCKWADVKEQNNNKRIHASRNLSALSTITHTTHG